MIEGYVMTLQSLWKAAIIIKSNNFVYDLPYFQLRFECEEKQYFSAIIIK